jgi:hypothetical protein
MRTQRESQGRIVPWQVLRMSGASARRAGSIKSWAKDWGVGGSPRRVR